MAVAYVCGYSNYENINYCPVCGERITIPSKEDFGKCEWCGFEFYVIDKAFEEEND